MVITHESILLAREWFANNKMACIEEVRQGKVKVNDPASYFEQCLRDHDLFLSGEYDNTLAFKQTALFIQTGECIALLP